MHEELVMVRHFLVEPVPHQAAGNVIFLPLLCAIQVPACALGLSINIARGRFQDICFARGKYGRLQERGKEHR